MILNKKVFVIYFSLFFTILSFTQENDKTKKDSTKIIKLEEVVITGQINPKSVKKSVFEVKVITRKDIERQAGNNLADVLNQTLNINIIPSSSTGKSTVQLFGLDGQYFKILIDNIPVINDEGLGNNTDLTQINLDDIQQIEIVEGAMGVQYGSNAVSGIINIITKKRASYKWQITPYLQEETVGNEYKTFNRGRHIQSFKLSHNISEKFFSSLTVTRNDFAGFLNKKNGENYELNDGLRGHDWLPKEQFNIKGLINYKTDKFKTFYKFEYFDETIDQFNNTVRPNFNSATQTTDPTASDRIFTSERFFHHLNFYGKFAGKVHYDISVSYQQQKRNLESYTYRIKTREKFDINKFEFESRKGFYSKGSFSNFINFDKAKFQLGYEISSIDGFASRVAGSFDGENINRNLGSYDAFVSSEFSLNDKLSFKPGARLLFSSRFDTQLAASISTRYEFKNNLEFRTIIGTSPRLPNYDELFTFFVDANHDVRGNENLEPEQGKSVFIHLKKGFTFKNKNIKLNSKLSSWYLDVNDRIELIVVNESPLAFKYNNIDTYKNWGLSFTNKINYKRLDFNIGASISGTSKILDSQADFNDDYLYALQLNSNISYNVPKWNTIVSAYVKHNGSQYQFVQQVDTNNNTIIVRGKQDSYNWMDVSIKKSFYKNSLQLTLGARNLTNITSVNTSAINGGAHNAPPASIILGYGRSYFFKLLYNLNIN